MPTVVFDVRANHDTGVARYGLSLLARTAPLAADSGWRLVVVARPHQESSVRAAAGRFAARVVCGPDEGFVRRAPWLRDLLLAEQADLYFTTHYTVDRRCPVPFVLTVHDLHRLRSQELSYTDEAFVGRFGRAEFDAVSAELDALAEWHRPGDGEQVFQRYFWALNRFLAARARHVVTVSQTSAADLRRLLGLANDRITIVPAGVDQSTFRRQPGGAVEAVRARHGLLGGPYLMFVGLAHPNKRLPWLVEHLARRRGRFPAGSRLAIVGGHGEHVPEVPGVLARYDAEPFVAFVGRVSDAELATLYSGAAALVTASVSEGGALPPLEALACGCPVIVTDIPAYREALGDAAWENSGRRLFDLLSDVLAPPAARTAAGPTPATRTAG
jgi:glycosyltransferase involved in cell wall biosynthesis